MLKLVWRDRAQGLLLGALALALPMTGCSTDDDVAAEAPRDDGALYAADSPLAVSLAAVPAELVAAARNHLHMVTAGLQGGDAWQDAELAPYAVPLSRPDVDGPAYYELKVVRNADSLGFIVVSTGDHDVPIPEFTTRGATKAEALVARAGGRARALYRLDSAVLVAEDASGEIADASWPQIPSVPAASSEPRTGPVAMGPWTGWKALKRDFARGFSREIAALRTQSAKDWDALRALRPASSLDPNVVARSWTDVYDQGVTQYECENNWAGPYYGTGNVNDLTAKWDQLNSARHIVSGSPSAMCASGCTPTAAAIILAWMDDQSRRWDSGIWSRPEMGRAFFRYKQPISIDNLPFINYGYRAPYVAQPPGTPLRAPADVYDYAAQPSQTWVTPDGESDEPETASSMTASQDMRRFLAELSMSMRTYCDGGTGNTQWGTIAGLQRFFDDHRIPVQVSTGSNPFGEPAFRENIITSLRNTGAPGFIHTGGWSGHTEVVNAHLQCRVRDKASGQITWNSSAYFYTNKGWGDGNVDGWISVGNLMSSTTFTPKSPWVKLQTQYSGKCADVPASSATLGLQMQQYSCHGGPNQRWYFMPGSDGSYLIRNMATNLCLDVSNNNTANNGPVGQYTCHGQTNQRWRAELRPDGKFLLRSVSSNKCLEAINFAQYDGAPLGQYNCDGASSQVWDLAQ
jgi:hypothetical protein